MKYRWIHQIRIIEESDINIADSDGIVKFSEDRWLNAAKCLDECIGTIRWGQPAQHNLPDIGEDKCLLVPSSEEVAHSSFVDVPVEGPDPLGHAPREVNALHFFTTF